MIVLKFAFRSVARRGWALLLIVLPAALLFAMLTVVAASEVTVRQLLEPGIAPRAIRLGTVEGVQLRYKQTEVNQLGRIPGLTPAPAMYHRCGVSKDEAQALNCGFTNRTYVQIWEMDTPVSPENLERWDAVKAGAIVTRAAASKYHWKLGDRITLTLYGFESDAIRSRPMELVITSIEEKYIDETNVYIHIDFYQQWFKPTLEYWVVWFLVDTAEHRAAAMEEIDKQMNEVNHPHLLWTMEVTKQSILGGSKLLRQSFRIAGGFSLLLVVFVSVALLILSIEQRTTELAALLAIGYRRSLLATCILVEGALLVFPAAVLGAMSVWLSFHDNPIKFDIIFTVKVGLDSVFISVTVGALIGFLAAMIPAWRVYRLDVLASLR